MLLTGPHDPHEVLGEDPGPGRGRGVPGRGLGVPGRRGEALEGAGECRAGDGGCREGAGKVLAPPLVLTFCIFSTRGWCLLFVLIGQGLGAYFYKYIVNWNSYAFINIVSWN